jgi:hypothetical protein
MHLYAPTQKAGLDNFCLQFMKLVQQEHNVEECKTKTTLIAEAKELLRNNWNKLRKKYL